MAESEQPDLTQLTVQLLSAYVGNNSVAAEDLAGLIASTRAALSAEAAPAVVEGTTYTPAVSVRKSVASPDHLLSLIDGKPYKLLKRHLAQHGLTPDQYRERYNLPRDYPMVAKGYSEERRATAARIGLGGRSKAGEKAAVPAPAAPAAESAAVPAATGAQSAPAPAALASTGKKQVKKRVAAPSAAAKAASAKPATEKPAATETAVASKPAAKPARAKAKAAEPAKPEAAPAASVDPKTKPARKAAAPKSAAKAAAAKPAAAAGDAGTSTEAVQPDSVAAPVAAVAQSSAKAPSVKAKPETAKAAKGDTSSVEKKPRKKLGLKIGDGKAG